MSADFYINESRPEREAVERWENEGGRFRQRDEWNLASIPRSNASLVSDEGVEL